MTENTQPDLASQFQELGENLKNMFQSGYRCAGLYDPKSER